MLSSWYRGFHCESTTKHSQDCPPQRIALIAPVSPSFRLSGDSEEEEAHRIYRKVEQSFSIQIRRSRRVTHKKAGWRWETSEASLGVRSWWLLACIRGRGCVSAPHANPFWPPPCLFCRIFGMKDTLLIDMSRRHTERTARGRAYQKILG